MNNELMPTILLVDDEILNIQILASALSDEHRILMAPSGMKAIEIAKAQLPDIIVLDINMPDISGYEVCKRLKADDATRSIPIVFATGRESEEDELYGLQLGAIDYLKKPFRVALIKARLKNLVDLKRKTDLLESLASIDGLTGIPNRRSFDETYDAEWRYACRKGRQISLILIDIDFFKQYNDHFGHAQGDECLRKVAKCIRNTAQRATDFVARYGGEEFVVVIRESDASQAIELAEKIRSAVEALEMEHPSSPLNHRVTVSLGAATVGPVIEEQPETMFELADKRLYHAKQQGRNKVVSD